MGDGSTTLRLADEMYKYSVQGKESPAPPVAKKATTSPRPVPQKMVWKLSLDVMSMCFKAYEVNRKERRSF